jgi:hypothetical protein
MFGKIVCGFFGGLMVTLFSAWVLGPVFVLIPSLAGMGSSILFWGIWLAVMVISIRTDRTSRAWRKVLLISAGLCFLMPISAILLTGSLASNASSGIQLSAMLGTGGSIFLASLIMVVFGIVFLISGLFIGRKKAKPSSLEPAIESGS